MKWPLISRGKWINHFGFLNILLKSLSAVKSIYTRSIFVQIIGRMKTIYQYSDHKIFLRDWFLERKKSPSGFSYERFSQLAGLGSPNYMKMVIEGKRNLT